VIRYAENRGKGYAVRLGLLEAQAISAFSEGYRPITETPKLIDRFATVNAISVSARARRPQIDWRASALAAQQGGGF
jgi:hypothetical protein